MKMKNAIKTAPYGVVKNVVAEQGKSVRYGDMLVSFKGPVQ